MAGITASMVRELREMTGAGMMECKKALEEAGGDMDEAVDVLRKHGLASAAKRAGRDTNEGTVVALVDDTYTKGAVVELNCETDFVGMNEKFKGYAQRFAQIALDNAVTSADDLLQCPDGNATVADTVAECIHVFGENTRLTFATTRQGSAITSYIHMGGRIGVLVTFDVSGIDPSLDDFQRCARDVAMQVAALSPVAVSQDSVPADIVSHEMEIYKAQAAESGKPEKIQERIAEGRMQKFYKENCLCEQQFVKDNDVTVQQYVDSCAKELGGKIAITDFVRCALGE